jgi:hypothetical protein
MIELLDSEMDALEGKKQNLRVALKEKIEDLRAAMEKQIEALEAATEKHIEAVQDDMDGIAARRQRLAEEEAYYKKQAAKQKRVVHEQLDGFEKSLSRAEEDPSADRSRKLMEEARNRLRHIRKRGYVPPDLFFDAAKIFANKMQRVLSPNEDPFDKPGSRLSKWMEEVMAPKKSDVEEDWPEEDKGGDKLRGLLGDPEHPKAQGREKKTGRKGSRKFEDWEGRGRTGHRRRGKKGRPVEYDDGW